MVGGLGQMARQVIQIENELHSPVRFRMAALAQLHGFDQIEGQGWELMAIFHSHPQGPAYPSRHRYRRVFLSGYGSGDCQPGGS